MDTSLLSSAPANRPAVLLLHGLCANPMELMPLARPLREAGYEVKIPALPGYGVPLDAAPGQSSVSRCEDWLAQVRDYHDALAAQHGAVIVGGLCMGAVLALALAAERPVRALLLVSTTLYFDGWNVSPWRHLLPLAYLPPLRERLSFRERPPYGIKNPSMQAWVAQAMTHQQVSVAGAARLSAAALHQASRLLRQVHRRLPAIQAPTLALQAVHDDVTSPRSVRTLEQRLGRPPEVRWFHDSYHMLTLDNERVAVAAAARDFLQRVAPAGRPAPVPATPLHPTQGVSNAAFHA